ncbi:hypothetical protein [Streptomyces antimycoticus]|uniref:hypothetical protein n=1 Tax=Streptomyces antimycoticus TaxID=68175 RepID=UPI0013A5691D|nr:hypothetical protein [Streptomyces antimycoticus]
MCHLPSSAAYVRALSPVSLSAASAADCCLGIPAPSPAGLSFPLRAVSAPSPVPDTASAVMASAVTWASCADGAFSDERLASFGT